MQPCACPEAVTRYLGETAGFWVQTLALFASAVAAVYLILDTRKGIERQIQANHAALQEQIKASQEAVAMQIRAANLAEERRATIDLMLSQNSDRNLKKAKSLIESLLASGTTNFAIFLQNRKSLEYLSFIYLLNTYEFMASAIREEALNEELLKRMQCTVILKNWGALESLVIELRRQDKHPTLFQEIQLMAERWKKHPLQSEV
jgi:hypothetical protein